MLTLFNYHPRESLIAKIRLADLVDALDYQVCDLDSGAYYEDADPKRGFLAEIPPEQILLLEIHPAKADKPTLIVHQTQLQEKLARYHRHAATQTTFATQTRDGLSAGLGILPPNSNPLVKLTAGGSVVCLDPEQSGAAISWKTAENTDILYYESRGLLDELRLFSYSKGINFTLKKVHILEDGASAEMFFRVPDSQNADVDDNTPAGLEISKTVTLSADGKKLISQYRFENASALNKALPIGARLRSYPRLGAELVDEGTPLSVISRIAVPTTNGGEYIVAQGMDDSSNLFFRSDCANDGAIRGTIRSHEYTGGEIVLTAEKGEKQNSLSFQTENMAGLLVWWTDNGPCTVEPLLENKLLPPGQSVTLTSRISIHP